MYGKETTNFFFGGGGGRRDIKDSWGEILQHISSNPKLGGTTPQQQIQMQSGTMKTEKAKTQDQTTNQPCDFVQI